MEPDAQKLWLIEFTAGGFVKFAWVGGSSRVDALMKLKEKHPLSYMGLISIDEHDRVVPLCLDTGNRPLFIDCERTPGQCAE